jgi:hypothetical protein
MRGTYAADDFATIREAAAKIRADAVPPCPVNAGRKLYDCLRSSSPCSPACPHVSDWIGPQKE